MFNFLIMKYIISFSYKKILSTILTNKQKKKKLNFNKTIKKNKLRINNNTQLFYES